MNTNITRARVERADQIRRRWRQQAEQIPFKDGSLLAVFYLVVTSIFSVISLLVSNFLVHGEGRSTIGYLIGLNLLLLCVSALTARLLLGQLAPFVLKRNSRISLLCVIIMLTNLLQTSTLVVAGNFVKNHPSLLPSGLGAAYFPESLPFLMPFLFAPALATMLVSRGAGIAIGVSMAVQNLFFVRPETILPILVIGIVVCVTLPCLLQTVYRRSNLLEIFGLVGCFQLVGILLHALLRCYWPHDSVPTFAFVKADVVLTFGSIVIDALATLAVMPVLEHLFGTSSNIRLRFYEDSNLPLLKQLKEQAPGTYTHSLNVAELASDAAEAIGANRMLARVGSLYHDIGKLVNPQMFIENLPRDSVNPQDGKKGLESALIIRSHVNDGLAFGKDLPSPIQNIIATHHGNSLIYTCWKKAVKEEQEAAEKTGRPPSRIDENAFRYTGGRPDTAEAAIVMMADSIEAASHSWGNVTLSNIEHKVSEIIDGKLHDGLLNEAPISLPQILELKRIFVERIATMMHRRIDYKMPPPDIPQSLDNTTVLLKPSVPLEQKP
ncbi:MAG: HDIG domain-containing metalloprotein [Kiritimatiellia bacterium]